MVLQNNEALGGKRVVITGGSKGIGYAIADLFLRQGAEVMIVARDADRISAAVDAWVNDDLAAHGFPADVSDSEDIGRIVDAALDRLSGVDILVHCAGTNIRKRTTDYDENSFWTIMRTNAWPAFELTRQLHSFLQSTENSSVLFIGSTAGITTVPTGAPYAMSKAALDQLTRYLAVEWAADGIRVNCVAPWYIRTPLVESVLANPEYLQRVLARTPMGRIGEAHEVANVALFLCSDAASYVTGQTIAVDGGFLAQGL
jgi:tropinone reductase I